MPSEFEDAYEDKQRIQGTLFDTTIGELTMCPAVVVDPSATVVSAVSAMNDRHTGCVLAQRDGKLVGIFTERDILTRVVFHDHDREIRVEAVMTRNPETLEASESIAYALNKMSVGGYRHIPIVDGDGQPVGVLSVRNIVDFLAELFPEHVLNLPPNPELGIPRSVDGG
jgi:CBS domain-containing protein